MLHTCCIHLCDVCVCETCVCVSVTKLCLGECMSVRYVSGKFAWDLCKRRTTDNVMHINRRHRSDTQATTVLHTLVRQCQSINESYLLLHALGQLACF